LIPHDPYYTFDCDTTAILLCYYIINYVTIAEGKSIVMEDVNHFPANKLLYDNLLEFHFRPRGLYTKSAIIN
jgi:hypothetical protein